MLKKVAKLAKQTVEQSPQTYQRLSKSAPTQLKEKILDKIELAEKLLEQTEHELRGQRSIPDRIVSFFDPEARAIEKGKLDKPVEFGRTLELVQDSSGVILHYEVHQGNPSDKTHLVSLVRETKTVVKQTPPMWLPTEDSTVPIILRDLAGLGL